MMILFVSGTASCKLYRRAKNWQLHMVLGYLVQDISWDFGVLFLVSRLTQSAFVSEIDTQSLVKELTPPRLYPLCSMIGSILWDLTNGRHWLELKGEERGWDLGWFPLPCPACVYLSEMVLLLSDSPRTPFHLSALLAPLLIMVPHCSKSGVSIIFARYLNIFSNTMYNSLTKVFLFKTSVVVVFYSKFFLEFLFFSLC